MFQFAVQQISHSLLAVATLCLVRMLQWSFPAQLAYLGDRSSAPAFLHIHTLISTIAQSHLVTQQAAVCTDDTQLHISFSPSELSGQINALQPCLASLDSWFCENGLALNPTRSHNPVWDASAAEDSDQPKIFQHCRRWNPTSWPRQDTWYDFRFHSHHGQSHKGCL